MEDRDEDVRGGIRHENEEALRVDITGRVAEVVSRSGVENGLTHVLALTPQGSLFS